MRGGDRKCEPQRKTEHLTGVIMHLANLNENHRARPLLQFLLSSRFSSRFWLKPLLFYVSDLQFVSFKHWMQMCVFYFGKIFPSVWHFQVDAFICVQMVLFPVLLLGCFSFSGLIGAHLKLFQSVLVLKARSLRFLLQEPCESRFIPCESGFFVSFSKWLILVNLASLVCLSCKTFS